MKIIKTLFVLSLFVLSTNVFSQKLPDNYEAIFTELIDNVELIRSGNSLKKGKHTLTVFSKEKIVLRTTYNKQVKNLTFVKEATEDNKMVWVAANQLTTDMVDRHEEDLTEMFMEMLELSRKKAKI
ncbi:MAG: hypothetical protein C0597_05815 [Marinilabiliales bacterium]|nr:MAG: hypothetical protein C0597_05815 [Marinilabiliales bacterium]